jgi:fermentation-respiration switch protein FrsA (DUF1100 family)
MLPIPTAHVLASLSTGLCLVVGAVHEGSLADPPAPAAATAAQPPTAGPSAEGIWQGMVLAGNGALFVRIEARLEGGHGVALVTLPQAMALKQEAQEVSLEGPKLALTLKAAGLSGQFQGEVAADGKSYAGELTLSGGQGDPLKVPFTLERTGDAKTTPGHERWEGTLDVGGTKLPFAITVAEHPTFGPLGAIDIPMQSLEGFPTMVTKGEAGKLTIRIPVGAEAVIEVTPKEGLLVGEMRQAGMSFPISLSRAGDKAVSGLARPQLPVPPFPYAIREVTIPHRFGHTLAGTLTLPPRPAAADGKPSPRLPAVVLVSGSGPQDRDETIFGHKPFLILADALSRAGIAVLRYDDRGVGKSTGNFSSATSHDFATDCDEATEWLRGQPDIDPSRIGIIGHSEGGLIAPMVAKWQWEEGDPATAVRFVVLLAGPGVSGAEVLEVQMRKLMASGGATAEEIESVSVLQIAAMNALREEKTNEELTPLVRLLVARQLDIAQAHGQAMPNVDLEQMTAAATAELGSAWMRTFASHDPRGWITALPIPVLAMQGGLDVQVDADQNLPAIETAAKAGNVPLTVRRFPNLNHLFQPATNGSLDEYGTIETTFDPAALKELVEWVVAKANDPSLQSIKPKARTPAPSPPPAKPEGKVEVKPEAQPEAAPAQAPKGTT